MRSSLFRRFHLNCLAAALAGSLATATAFAQDAAPADAERLYAESADAFY
ncbi:MAG: hypothetical protein IJO46_07090 [Thermoguttaceae bacterium]|nr:hypothetical protein [Thermoguttaceae bacterium]